MNEFKMFICTIDNEPCKPEKICKDCEKYKLAKALHEFLTTDKEVTP